jgi:hypothetical protein
MFYRMKTIISSNWQRNEKPTIYVNNLPVKLKYPTRNRANKENLPKHFTFFTWSILSKLAIWNMSNKLMHEFMKYWKWAILSLYIKVFKQNAKHVKNIRNCLNIFKQRLSLKLIYINKWHTITLVFIII